MLFRRRRNDTAAPAARTDAPALVMRGLSLTRNYYDLPSRSHRIDWSKDGSFLAAGGGSEFVIWSASGHQPVRKEDAVDGDVYGLAWHPARSVLATGDGTGTVRLW